MGDSEESDGSHIKLHPIAAFPQGSLVKTNYQGAKVVGGTTAVIVSSASATTHLQTTSTQVNRALPIQAATANYHVPRGAAAVANMAAPRSSVATPVLRGPPPQLTIGTRTVLPTGVQASRPPSKIPAHHVGAVRGRGLPVASKQQQVVGGRLLGSTLVAAPRPANIASAVLTKPVMLSTSTIVRGTIPGQSTPKIFQTSESKIYQQTDQPATLSKHYQEQSAAQKICQQSGDQPSTTGKIIQTDQSTTICKSFQSDQPTAAKHYQPTLPDGTTLKVYHPGDQTKFFHAVDQSSATSAKVFPQTDQSSQQQVFIHHKPQIGKYFSGSMYVSQSGGSGTGVGGGGGVVVASGMAQTHGTVTVVPHSTTVQQHSSAVTQQHQHQHQHAAIVQQHTSTLNQPHATLLQPHQISHSGITQQSQGTMVTQQQQHVTVAQHQGATLQQGHAAVVQGPHAVVQQQHGGGGGTPVLQPSHSHPHSAPILQTHVGLVSSHTPLIHQSSVHSGGGVTLSSQAHSIVATQGPSPHHTAGSTASIQPSPSPSPSSSTSTSTSQTSQTSQYIEISRQVARPPAPHSQPSTSIHQQSTSCQVMRFNPVVVVEGARTQSFQGILSAGSGANTTGGGGGSNTSDSATLTALPQSIVQPNIQAIAMTPTQPVSSQPTHIPIVSVGQQVSISTSVGQITAHSVVAQSVSCGTGVPTVTISAGGVVAGTCIGTGVGVGVSSIPHSLSSAVAQSLTPKQNTSPRPSILRKRDPDSWSGNLKAQRNLAPVLSGLSVVAPPPLVTAAAGAASTLQVGNISAIVQTPVTPQSQTNPDDDAPPGSGGSSTLSAASSPDQPPIIDQPSPATSVSNIISGSSPRKKPRKQQLPHNPPPSRPSPFSDEDMQFLTDKPNSNSKSVGQAFSEWCEANGLLPRKCRALFESVGELWSVVVGMYRYR